MNNAALIAERDFLHAASIRYTALDQFISCGCNPDGLDAHFESMQDTLRSGVMEETIRTLSSSIEDVAFGVLNKHETFQAEAK